MILHIVANNDHNVSSSMELAYLSIISANSNDNGKFNKNANNNYTKVKQALLLLGEASYHLINKDFISIKLIKLIEHNVKVFALQDDCLARGINISTINEHIEIISYERFVDLVKLYPKNISW